DVEHLLRLLPVAGPATRAAGDRRLSPARHGVRVRAHSGRTRFAAGEARPRHTGPDLDRVPAHAEECRVHGVPAIGGVSRSRMDAAEIEGFRGLQGTVSETSQSAECARCELSAHAIIAHPPIRPSARLIVWCTL